MDNVCICINLQNTIFFGNLQDPILFYFDNNLQDTIKTSVILS